MLQPSTQPGTGLDRTPGTFRLRVAERVYLGLSPAHSFSFISADNVADD